ncbi:MAG: DNA translocase FtsK [Planctomycetes bacterium]|nr:DNA translocase FtsK [Planctomycetota bacterium]
MEDKKAVRITISICLVVFSVVFFLSLFTYRDTDLYIENYVADEPQTVHNCFGKAGLYLAYYARTLIGPPAAYLMAILLGLWGAAWLYLGAIPFLPLKVLGGLLSVVSVASLVSCLSANAGGAIGLVLHELGTEYVGTPGLFFGAVGLTALGLLLVSRTLFMGGVRWTGKGTMAVVRQLPLKRSEPSPAAPVAAAPQPPEPVEAEEEPPAPEPETGKITPKSADEPEEKLPRLETVEIEAEAKPQPAPAETEETEKEEEKAEQKEQKEERAEPPIRVRPPKPPRPASPAGGTPRPDGSTSQYQLPPIDMLERPIIFDGSKQEDEIRAKAAILEKALTEFGIGARVVEIERGPVITFYELELAPGVKVGRIIGLSDDLAMAVKAPSVRVVAPIPGKSTVGLEVPNNYRDTVRLRDLMESQAVDPKRYVLPILLGKDAAGAPLVSDLAQMPHLLIAGATGSGKSVCINSIIMSILMSQYPEDVKLLIVDPKMVELSTFKDIPHLLSPVVTDMKKAAAVLDWAVNKMDERYSLLARAGVRNISGYNKLGEEGIRKRLMPEEDADLADVPFRMPHVVIVVDELADLMMVASKEVEGAVTRLSQKSRAVGIHLILATQRPSVDVITGLIKANLPARVSFHVSSKVDSRTILDRNGAEKLLGSGDMLLLPPGTSKLVRAQGTYVSDDEIRNVVEFLKKQAEPEYSKELFQWGSGEGKDGQVEDDLYNEAVRIILESQRGSLSLLQRRLEIGYSRAARLIDLMAENGVVGEYKGSQSREVLITLEEWEKRQAKAAAEAAKD